MNECNIGNDLLPLYADELASPDSVEYIRRHIAWCPECNEVWKRLSTSLPDMSPREEANNYRKGIRRGKFRIYLKSILLCLIALAIALGFLAYQLYAMGFHPVSHSFPSPDGGIVIEVVESDDIRPFYPGEGIMVRFKMNGRHGGLNRYETEWDTLSVYWASDSKFVVLDTVTIQGNHAIFICDAQMQYTCGGLAEIPSITEDLIPIFEEALKAENTFENIDFSFETWQEDCETATFQYVTDTGLTGTIDYHYPTNSVANIR